MIKSTILIALQISISSFLLSQDNGIYIFNDTTENKNEKIDTAISKNEELNLEELELERDTNIVKIVITDKKNEVKAPKELEQNISLLKSKNSPTLKEGYSIQLLFNKDINKVKQAQSEFKLKHPNIYNYLSYKEPNFRLRVGSFRTKMEASKLLNQLKPEYPGAYEVTELNIQTPQLN